MTEAEFIESIDCRFPYGAPLKWKRLVALAPRVSTNAAFMVLHELCRPPRSATVSHTECHRILKHLERRFRHPLLSGLRNLVLIVMRGKRVSVSTAAAAMRKVSRYPGQYNMLAICYCSCDDRDGRLDTLHEAITTSWESPNNLFNPDALTRAGINDSMSTSRYAPRVIDFIVMYSHHATYWVWSRPLLKA